MWPVPERYDFAGGNGILGSAATTTWTWDTTPILPSGPTARASTTSFSGSPGSTPDDSTTTGSATTGTAAANSSRNTAAAWTRNTPSACHNPTSTDAGAAEAGVG